MLTNFILGSVVGLVLALTGGGGGILAVPLLVFSAQISVAEAGSIGLLAVGMSAALGALLGLRTGIVRGRAALLVAAIGMLAALVGQWMARQVDNRWLVFSFALILAYVAWKTYRKAAASGVVNVLNTPVCVRSSQNGHFVWTQRCANALSLSGGIMGLLSGLLGVGGGFVLVPALQRYTDLPMKSAVATSLAVIALVSVTSVTNSAISGTMNWRIALPFCAGAIAGMIAGRRIAARLAGPQLQKVFAAVSAMVAVAMIGKAFA